MRISYTRKSDGYFGVAKGHCNWVIIKVPFAPLTMERYTLSPLGTTMSIIALPNIVAKVLVIGRSEDGNEKRVQTSKQDN